MRVLVAVVTLFLLSSTAITVTESQEATDLFSAVPQAERESLREAMTKNIMYQTKRQWPEMYKLYDNQRNISLEQFVREMNTRIKLIDFTPYKVTYLPSVDYWSIDGCAVFAGNAVGKGPVDAVIIARRISNDWRLDEVAISPRKGPPRCTVEKK
jgi:hypothetical protein